MIASTLVAVMPGLSLARAEQLIASCNQALNLAHCVTVDRAAMFLAQVGEESVSLRYSEEIADGSAYNGRLDLGNVEPGDGPRFKGRTFIQITGREHYRDLSLWAHGKGVVPTSTYFLEHPEQLAADAYVWLGPVWYWTVARPQLNALADAGDIEGATRAVNGGLNGFADRTQRWHFARSLGSALLPYAVPTPPSEEDMALIIRRKGGKSWPVAILGGTKVVIDDADSAKALVAAGAKSATVSPRVYARIRKGAVK